MSHYITDLYENIDQTSKKQFHARLIINEDKDDSTQLLLGKGDTRDEAVSEVFSQLHIYMFGTNIHPNRDNNFHDYCDPLEFKACCLRGYDIDDFRPTAMLIWSTLQTAAGTLLVQNPSSITK